MPFGAAPPPLVVRRRGDEVECVRRGWLVLWEDGRETAVGDPATPIFTRSCTKPFQALAFVASGAADRFGCSAEEIALACASHDGTVEHRAVAARMLARAGIGEEQLQCGASEPYGDAAHRAFLLNGEKPSPLVHNCSGKHASFLLTQIHLGGAAESYLEPASPLQKRIRQLVSRALDVPVDDLGVYLDGCSAPTFRPPIRALARGFARLANPEIAPADLAPHLARIRDAIASYPETYSGPARLCAAILRASGGAIVPKNGAEGVYAFGVRGRRAGFAVKVEDGAARGYELAVLETLRAKKFLSDGALAALAPFATPELRNAAGRAIGRQELVAPL